MADAFSVDLLEQASKTRRLCMVSKTSLQVSLGLGRLFFLLLPENQGRVSWKALVRALQKPRSARVLAPSLRWPGAMLINALRQARQVEDASRRSLIAMAAIAFPVWLISVFGFFTSAYMGDFLRRLAQVDWTKVSVGDLVATPEAAQATVAVLMLGATLLLVSFWLCAFSLVILRFLQFATSRELSWGAMSLAPAIFSAGGWTGLVAVSILCFLMVQNSELDLAKVLVSVFFWCAVLLLLATMTFIARGLNRTAKAVGRSHG